MAIHKRLTASLVILSCLGVAASASGAAIYIGDAASQGLAVTAAGGPRADTVNVLTYILHTGSPTVYTAPSNQQLMLTEVNFFADRGGTLTPFVARFLGGSTQTATNYQILAKGDPLLVTSSDATLGPSAGDHLENRAFTVAAVNPIISVTAGDLIVAGWLQNSNIVYIGGGPAQGAGDYIRNGDALTTAVVGGAPIGNSNFNFDRQMQFNIGFNVVAPEINILGLGNSIADGDNTPSALDDTSFGSVIVGAATVNHVFTVENTGDVSLSITSPATVVGSAPFSISNPLPASIASSGNAPLGVQMTTGVVGNFSATVSVSNNDTNENPYNFDVAGSVLSHSSGSLQNVTGDAAATFGPNSLLLDFGTVAFGAGGGELISSLDVLNVVGPNGALLTAGLELDSLIGAGDVSEISYMGPNSFANLAAGNSQAYSFLLDTNVVGSFTATYTFNFSDQNLPGDLLQAPFVVTLQGSVLAVPEASSTAIWCLLAGIGLIFFRNKRRN